MAYAQEGTGLGPTNNILDWNMEKEEEDLQAYMAARPWLFDNGGKGRESSNPFISEKDQIVNEQGARPKVFSGENERDPDLVSIKDTCNYITRAVKNLNENYEDMSLEAKEVIMDMNRSISIARRPPDVSFKASSVSSRSSVSGDDRRAPGDRNVRFPRSNVGGRPDYDRARGGEVESRWLLDALARMDTRAVPKPEPFDVCSRQSFETFLCIFEEYCTHTFRGSPDLWVHELGRFLEGDIKQAFEANMLPGDNYSTIKRKLQKWAWGRRDILDGNTKDKFNAARMEYGESVTLYAARLEKLFRLAYPERTVQTSSTLRKKLIDTTPRSLSNELQSARNLIKSLTDQDITWAKVQSYLHEYEANNRPGRNVRISSAGQEVGACGCQEVSYASPVNEPPRGGNSGSTYRQPEQRGRYPRAGEGSMIRCYHCNKLGHIKVECRTLLNLCYLCGSPSHRISQCPDLRRGPRERNNDAFAAPRDPPRHNENMHPRANFGGTSDSLRDQEN